MQETHNCWAGSPDPHEKASIVPPKPASGGCRQLYKSYCDCSPPRVVFIIVAVALAVLLSHFLGGIQNAAGLSCIGVGTALGLWTFSILLKQNCPIGYRLCCCPITEPYDLT